MFSTTTLIENNLSDKEICLTFDDGPGVPSLIGNIGPKTLELAQYLHEQGIVATFFMVGKFIKKYPGITKAVSELGHIIGHHTTTHPDLVKYWNAGNDLIPEFIQTEELIKNLLPKESIYFRPPHGKWNETICNHVNNHFKTNYNYIGPIGWNIDACDWMYWSRIELNSAAKCAEAYLKTIHLKKKGIILMHDSTANKKYLPTKFRKLNNKTLETIKIIVPQLKKDGFSFISLDKIQFSSPS
jgi:peptidoglycan/xylan/chitin deacetylase (PgdA/CDA1 family)